MHQWEKETQMPWQIIVKCRLLAFLLPLYGQSIYDPKDTGVSTNFLAYKYLCSCQNAQGRSFDGTEVALLHRGGTRLLEEEASSLQDGHMKLEQITHAGHLRASKLPCPPHFFVVHLSVANHDNDKMNYVNHNNNNHEMNNNVDDDNNNNNEDDDNDDDDVPLAEPPTKKMKTTSKNGKEATTSVNVHQDKSTERARLRLDVWSLDW